MPDQVEQERKTGLGIWVPVPTGIVVENDWYHGHASRDQTRWLRRGSGV